jgi:DNA polymerase-3 subunit delta'
VNVWDKLHRSRVVEGIARQLESRKVSHSWLLLGPSGSGKRATALAMAAALNCETQPGIGCGTCSPCSRILRRRYPDVHHVLPEGPLIPVDVVREQINPEASRSPFEGRYKVFIIEEADRMNESAQNAILKTLEEPQPDTVFILISHFEEEVLETIRSRCRVVHLEPVSEARIIELLEEDGAPEQVAVLAARVSEGDFERAHALAEDPEMLERRRRWVGLAARLWEPVAAFDAATELMEDVRHAVKDREGSQKEEIQELAEAMGEGRGTAHARNALAKRHKRELRRLEEDLYGEALGGLASFYRDILAVRRGGEEAVTNLDLVDRLPDWSALPVPDGAIVAAVDRCLQARASFRINANAALAIESTFLELGRLVPPPDRAAIA